MYTFICILIQLDYTQVSNKYHFLRCCVYKRKTLKTWFPLGAQRIIIAIAETSSKIQACFKRPNQCQKISKLFNMFFRALISYVRKSFSNFFLTSNQLYSHYAEYDKGRNSGRLCQRGSMYLRQRKARIEKQLEMQVFSTSKCCQ